MTGGRAARLSRVQKRMAELDVDVLLLSLGADLPWITGYEASPGRGAPDRCAGHERVATMTR